MTRTSTTTPVGCCTRLAESSLYQEGINRIHHKVRQALVKRIWRQFLQSHPSALIAALPSREHTEAAAKEPNSKVVDPSGAKPIPSK